MRYLGLDIGASRVGVAVSDPGGVVATPLAVLDGRTLVSEPSDLAEMIEEYEVGAVVIGLPLSLDGGEGPQAQEVRRVANGLAETLACPLLFHDERLSSVEADRALVASGLDGRARKERIDMAAAAIMLQSYLDASRDDGDAE